MSRHAPLVASCLLALLAVLVSAPAAWAEEAEGQGWTFDLPQGFRLEYDSGDADDPFSGGMLPTFTLGGFGEAVQSELKVYVRGPKRDPKAVLMVISGRLTEHQDHVTQQTLDRLRGSMQASLGEDVEVDVRRTAGPNGFEAMEIGVDLAYVQSIANAGVEGKAFVLAVPAGDYAVTLVLMNLDPEAAFTAETEWQVLKSTLDIDPPTTPKQALMYAAIGALVLGLLYLGLRAFQSAGAPAAPPGLEEELDLGKGSLGNPSSMQVSGEARETSKKRSPVAGAPPGLRSTFTSQPKPRAEAPPPPRAEPSAASVLKPTLPSSGRWSDANRPARK